MLIENKKLVLIEQKSVLAVSGINTPISSSPYHQVHCLPSYLNPRLSSLLTTLSHLTLPVMLKYFQIRTLKEFKKKRKFFKKIEDCPFEDLSGKKKIEQG